MQVCPVALRAPRNLSLVPLKDLVCFSLLNFHKSLSHNFTYECMTCAGANWKIKEYFFGCGDEIMLITFTLHLILFSIRNLKDQKIPIYLFTLKQLCVCVYCRVCSVSLKHSWGSPEARSVSCGDQSGSSNVLLCHSSVWSYLEPESPCTDHKAWRAPGILGGLCSPVGLELQACHDHTQLFYLGSGDLNWGEVQPHSDLHTATGSPPNFWAISLALSI